MKTLVHLAVLAATVHLDFGLTYPQWTKDGWFMFVGDNGLQAINGHGALITISEDSGPFRSAHGGATDAVASRVSPDGKATAEIKINAQGAAGTWKGNVFTPAEGATADLRVTRDGKSWRSMQWYSSAYEAKTYWSADGRYVAWVVTTSSWHGMDGTSSTDVGVGAGGGARCQLLADKAILSKAAPLVSAPLDKAGYPVTFIGPAKKARDATVVYAADGMEDEAKKVAALIPGGATVDKLTWAADTELVVAIGKSVLK